MSRGSVWHRRCLWSFCCPAPAADRLFAMLTSATRCSGLNTPLACTASQAAHRVSVRSASRELPLQTYPHTSQKPSRSLSTVCAGASSRVLLDLTLTEAAAAAAGAGQGAFTTGARAWHGALNKGVAGKSGSHIVLEVLLEKLQGKQPRMLLQATCTPPADPEPRSPPGATAHNVSWPALC